MKTIHTRFLYTLSLFSIMLFSRCEDFVQIDPPRTELVTPTVFKNDATAEAAVIGIYARMTESPSFASGFSPSITGLASLCSDEILFNAQVAGRLEFLSNSLTPGNDDVRNTWNGIYNFIYAANGVLEGLEQSTGVSPAVKDQVAGEAKFIRAFCLFYLVNLWGDVPLVLTTDYRVNSTIARSPSDEVYAEIINDLTDARELLREDYSISGSEKIRPNKFVVSAFLARVYLYRKNWVNAEAQATAVINNTTHYNLVSVLNNVFLKNSSEAIWQLFPANTTLDAYDGQLFVPNPGLIGLGIVPTYSLSSQLLSSFEASDARLTSWTRTVNVGGTDYVHPYKYKVRTRPAANPITEYSMILRLAEQHLIRAEARAWQNNITGANSAESDLNMIRSRAGLPGTTATTQDAMLAAIEHERRIEMFSEWGHRWFDLKRTDRADAVLNAVKPNWNAEDVLWPIPQQERILNTNLTQNDGY